MSRNYSNKNLTHLELGNVTIHSQKEEIIKKDEFLLFKCL